MLKSFYRIFFILISLSISSAYSVDTQTLRALFLLKNQQYSEAVLLMEQEIVKTKSKAKIGRYALLLHQLPLNIPMEGKRHEYAFKAVRWAKDIPQEKRLGLWIEAADGFFKAGDLKQADFCYKKAFIHVVKDQSEFAYILHKQAWIQVNRKHWVKAFKLLILALDQKNSRVRQNVLSDMGKIWVESQFFKNSISFSEMTEKISTLSYSEQKKVAEGMIQGINRVERQNIDVVVAILAVNSKLSTYILNQILAGDSPVATEPCRLINWIEHIKFVALPRKSVISILNTCVQHLTKKRSSSRFHKMKLKKVIGFYKKIKDIQGIERWPIALAYDYIGLDKSACYESLDLMADISDSNIENKVNDQELKKATSEALRLCRNIKKSSNVVARMVKIIFSSDRLIKKYRKIDLPWENTLFNLLNLKFFHPDIRKNILQAKTGWKEKDLLPQLVFSRMKYYSSSEIRSFLDLFGSKPLEGYYLDLFLAREDLLEIEHLQKWLPISKVRTYSQLLPYLKKAISNIDNFPQINLVVKKLLEIFPKEKEAKKLASQFLAVYYLKTQKLVDIFEQWEKLQSAFYKKELAVELFESTLYSKKGCKTIKLYAVSRKMSSFPVLRFTHNACKILKAGKDLKVVHNLRMPNKLKSSRLAWDFVILSQTKKKTIRLKKSISQLGDRTAKMILSLKKSVLRTQKRKWRLQQVAQRMQFFLGKQIDFFEAELTRLSKSSPQGEKYKELRIIVSQWR